MKFIITKRVLEIIIDLVLIINPKSDYHQVMQTVRKRIDDGVGLIEMDEHENLWVVLNEDFCVEGLKVLKEFVLIAAPMIMGLIGVVAMYKIRLDEFFERWDAFSEEYKEKKKAEAGGQP